MGEVNRTPTPPIQGTCIHVDYFLLGKKRKKKKKEEKIKRENKKLHFLMNGHFTETEREKKRTNINK